MGDLVPKNPRAVMILSIAGGILLAIIGGFYPWILEQMGGGGSTAPTVTPLGDDE